MIQYLRLHICAVASSQNLFALDCSAKEMKWLVLIYQLDKCGVTWMLSLPLIKIWTTLLLRRRLMGKTASSARINRAFHLLVFPCSCVFKFEPVREPDACIRLLQRKSWVPSHPEDRLTNPDWPYSMSRAFSCVLVLPPNWKKKKKGKKKEAVLIEGRSRIGNVPAGAKERGWISHWSDSQREESGEAWAQDQLWLSSINNQGPAFVNYL